MRQEGKALLTCNISLRGLLKIFVVMALMGSAHSIQATADSLGDTVIEDEYCANLFQAKKTGQRYGILDEFLCMEKKENFEEYLKRQQAHDAKIHHKFSCKAGLFSKTETYQIYGNWKTSKGEALANIPPWYFIPIEASEDKERTLVIHETKLSAAMVTKTRRFSNSKGYYWDEEKYYCQREHYDH